MWEGPRARTPKRSAANSIGICTHNYRRGAEPTRAIAAAEDLELSRKLQRMSGKPPRYAGTCRGLTAAQRAAARGAGLKADAAVCRADRSGRSNSSDAVHGPQRFASNDIGDFIIRREDGTPAFFFCNAVDDSAMGVTQVLRGDDHLTNTPRQIMLLDALGMRSSGLRTCWALGGRGRRAVIEAPWQHQCARVSRAGILEHRRAQSVVSIGSCQRHRWMAACRRDAGAFPAAAFGPGAGALRGVAIDALAEGISGASVGG